MWIQRVTIAIGTHPTNVIPLLGSQINYPPFQLLLYGAFLSPFGFSVTGARVISLVLSVLSTYLLYVLTVRTTRAIQMSATVSIYSGMVASLLFITSPILIYVQSLAIKEALFIPLILLTLLSYLAARTRGRFSSWVWGGVWLTILFFTKYEPAGFIAIALGIEGVIAMIIEKKKFTLFKGYVALFGIPVVCALLWLYSSPGYMSNFWAHITYPLDSTGGRDIVTNLLFYPRAIFYFYGITFSVGLILIVSWIMALFYIKRTPMRILWIVFTTNVAILAPRFINLEDRYLAIGMPALFVLAAIQIVTLVRHISRAALAIRVFWIIVCIFLSIELMFRLASLDLWVYGVGIRAMFSSYAFNQPDANTQWFNYNFNSWGKRRPSESKEHVSDMTSFITGNVNPFVPFTLRGRFSELAPPYVQLLIEGEKAKQSPHASPYSQYYITATVIPGSRYYTQEYRKFNEWVQWEVNETESDPTLVQVAKKTFPEFGVTIGIYGKH